MPPHLQISSSPRRVSLNLCLDWRESWTSPFFNTPHFCARQELWKDFLTEQTKPIITVKYYRCFAQYKTEMFLCFQFFTEGAESPNMHSILGLSNVSLKLIKFQCFQYISDNFLERVPVDTLILFLNHNIRWTNVVPILKTCFQKPKMNWSQYLQNRNVTAVTGTCLLYTSDAADE